MEYICIKDHRASYEKIAWLKKNSKLKILEEDKKYRGWLFCEIEDSSEKRWIHRDYLKIDEKRVFLIKNYTPDELTIKISEKLEGELVLGGWIWCINEKMKKVGYHWRI